MVVVLNNRALTRNLKKWSLKRKSLGKTKITSLRTKKYLNLQVQHQACSKTQCQSYLLYLKGRV